ncbi:signal peptidase II [Amycolatopsis rhabdoformis]|uniref:Lipoprotein signal peptidase n=1 Tax=Amycolatopsis rhabdoformis TaxID=1448059 RepID=A0ABZ1IIZ5_9PSEU|nr:signal peptidase II [Amycolatopsis rhabdoformis]WSE34351.1 signal peptidase II [Amycolatopsis rhabdoformis]
MSTESSSSEHGLSEPGLSEPGRPEGAPSGGPAPESDAAADTGGEDAVEPAPRLLPKRRVGLVFAVAALIWVIDLVSKNLVAANLEGKEPVRILGGLIYLQVIRNPGAAFSMATGMTWVLALVAAAVAVAIIWLSRRLRSVGWAIGLGLVLAGALGNLTDRIFRAPGPLRGHVIDFISAFAPNGEGFAIFNIADSAICVGGVLIVLLSLLGKDYDGTSTRDKKEKSA